MRKAAGQVRKPSVHSEPLGTEGLLVPDPLGYMDCGREAGEVIHAAGSACAREMNLYTYT